MRINWKMAKNWDFDDNSVDIPSNVLLPRLALRPSASGVYTRCRFRDRLTQPVRSGGSPFQLGCVKNAGGSNSAEPEPLYLPPQGG
jgi:hypothetical protein